MSEAPYIDLSLMTPAEAGKYAEKLRPVIETILRDAPSEQQAAMFVVLLMQVIRQTYIAGGVAAVQALDQQGVYVEVRGLKPGDLEWPPPGLKQ